MTYTIRAVLRTSKINKEGLSPVNIVVTVDRKRAYIKTGHRILETQWDSDRSEVLNHSNAKLMNAAIRKQMSDLEKEIIHRQIDGRTITAAAISAAPLTNFYQFVKKYKGSKTLDRKESNRILACFGGGLLLSEVDLAAIHRYEKFEEKRGMAHNTIHTSLKWFRRVMTLAVRHKLIKSNPFEEYDMRSYVQSERFFLDAKERNRWVKFWKEKKVSGSLYTTLTYFLIGVFSGLRHSDWTDVQSRVAGKFLRLRALKNKEWVVLPIGTTLAKLLKEAKDLPPPFSGDKSRDHLKIIAGILETKMNVTTHVARHSFGAMCAELGLPKSVTAELMGITVRTVEVYYHLTGTNIIDQAAALKKV